MQSDIIKACADFMRENFTADGIKFKSSHAHELTAAFFGYSSKAALLADHEFPIGKLNRATLLIPDVELMTARIEVLQGVSVHLCDAYDLATLLIHYLEDEEHFSGDVWLGHTLEHCLMEDFLPAYHTVIDAQLSSIIASSNTPFAMDSLYEGFTHKFKRDQLIVTLSGAIPSEPVPGKVFNAEILSYFVDVEFSRVAGKAAFLLPKISVRKNRIFRDPGTEDFSFAGSD